MHDGLFLEKLIDRLGFFRPEGIQAFADADVLASIQNNPEVTSDQSQARWAFRGVTIKRVSTMGYLIRPNEAHRYRDEETGQFVSPEDGDA